MIIESIKMKQLRIISSLIIAIGGFLFTFNLIIKSYFIPNFLIRNQFLLLLISIFVILGIFFGELIVFKQFRKNDLIFLLDIIKTKQIKRGTYR